jgi:diguanylate cyclase (GGDEF)-like protein
MLQVDDQAPLRRSAATEPRSDAALHERRALLIQGRPEDAKKLSTLLSSEPRLGFELVHATSPTAALEALHDERFGLIVLDLTSPSASALDSVRAVLGAAPRTPLVVLCGADDEDFALEAVQAGAQEVLFDGEVDRRALIHAVRCAIERRRAEERLAYLAHHDPLTGLANRALLRERLTHALARARRARERVAVLFLDLDRFKAINDTHGHEVGDQLLVEVAGRMRTLVREGETIARLGGDEFVVVLEGIKRPDDAVTVARRILRALWAPMMLKDQPLRVGTSIGIAISREGCASWNALVDAADRAMYQAKRRGRSCYELCREAGDGADEVFRLACDLEQAMSSGALQVLFALEPSPVPGAPLVVRPVLRWQDERRGTLETPELVALIDRAGVEVRVGDWVIERTCVALEEWSRAGCEVRAVLSPSVRQLTHPEFAARAGWLLASCGVPGSSLILEFTQTGLPGDVARCRPMLEELRTLGLETVEVDRLVGLGIRALPERAPAAGGASTRRSGGLAPLLPAAGVLAWFQSER